MKWLVVAALVLAVLILLVVGGGYVLPRDHTATSTIRLTAAPDSVWAVVRDIGRYPDWWSRVREMERISADGGRETWRQVDRSGTMPFEIVQEVPGRLLVTRIVDDGLPFGGTWTYEVQPMAGGAVVRVTEDGSVYNPIFRFMARFVFGHHGTMDDYLGSLAGRFGDDARPVHEQ